MIHGAPARKAWRADGSWAGRTVVIVGGGSSLNLSAVRQIGMARAADLVRVIAINDAVYPCWYADIAYACDAKWWLHHGGLPDFVGWRIGLVDHPKLPAEVMLARNTGAEGFDPEPSSVRTGRNGGYQTLHIAIQMGAARVLLVAYDMHGQHWFGHHPQEISANRNPNMGSRIRFFAQLNVILEGMGVEVVNVTPNSRLDAFRRGDLETELRSIR